MTAPSGAIIFCWRLGQRNLATAAATTSATALPTTAPTIVGILELCAEPTDAAVVVWDGEVVVWDGVVVVWDGATLVLVLWPLKLEVVLVVLLQWVYMLLFVAASSSTPVSMVKILRFVFQCIVKTRTSG